MEEDKDDESSGTHEGSGEHIYLAMCSEVDDPERKPQAKFNLKIWSDILPTQQDVFYEDLGKEMGFMRGSVLSSGLAPFRLHWCFGINTRVDVLNLCDSDRKRKAVVFAACQAGIVFDVENNEMKVLEGHQNAICSLSVDGSGKYLVTADTGEDNAIVIWDLQECKPIYTIFDPYPEEATSTEESSSSSSSSDGPVVYGHASEESVEVKDPGTASAVMSPNAKYLVSVGNARASVKLWLWTYGRDEADGEYTIKEDYGSCVNVVFHPNCQENIMVAFEKQVAFFAWDEAEKKLVLNSTTQIRTRRRSKFGLITDCTYAESCHESFACTDEGYVHVFGNTIYRLPFEEAAEPDNEKMYVKTVRILKNSRINCIKSVDCLIVTGDDSGRILFFDRALKLLYWIAEPSSQGVAGISFRLNPRKYRFVDPADFDNEMFVLESPGKFLEENYEDKSEEIEILYESLVPRDATLQKRPFVIRDFVMMTTNGDVFAVDYINGDFKRIISSTRSKIKAIETHAELPYVAVGHENGDVCLYNYETLEKIVCDKLPAAFEAETEQPATITALKYSPGCKLACGRSNGELWFLEPILQQRKTVFPFEMTRNAVEKISFSIDSNYCAYYDANRTTCLLRFDHEQQSWMIHGKIRAHYKPINDIMFSLYEKEKFFTLGQDRYLIQYDAKKSVPEAIDVVVRQRIEQSAVPRCFTYLQQNPDLKKNEYILYADDQFKYKTIYEHNFNPKSAVLAPAYGCYKDHPVQKIINLPGHDENYFIFVTDRHIGIQSQPLTGNPYKFLGMFGHPRKILDACITFDGKYLFTVGDDECLFFMWKTQPETVNVMEKIGGTELQPFHCLIEGGATGWIFKEMQDLFFYMQILHQEENLLMPRVVGDKLPIVELPDLMRACGYFPSEFEINFFLSDIKERDMETTGLLRVDITFIEFVQLYINHRPAYGISIEEMESTYDAFSTYVADFSSVDRDDFVEALCNKGEYMARTNAHKCLAMLMNEEIPANVEDIDFEFLPDSIDFGTFMEDILGINVEEERERKVEEYGNQNCRETS